VLHLILKIFFLFAAQPATDSVSIKNTTIVSDTVTSIKEPIRLDSIENPDTAGAQTLKVLPPPSSPRNQATELWVFIACCLTFFLAGINRRINEKKHDQSILGFLNLGILGQATDRSFYEFNIHQLLGLIVHNLTIALWCFYFLKDTEARFVDNNLLFFILLFFLVSFIYMCKFFFQYLALNILQINDLPVLLVKCTISLGYLTSLISLPVFMIVYYIQYPEWHAILINIFVLILGVYLLFRVFKYLQLFGQFFGASIFYNILYFCGLELIPLLVFIKISSGIF